jgi:hypothetical protein
MKDCGDLLVRGESTGADVSQTLLDGGPLVLAQSVDACATSANLTCILREFLLILKRPHLNFFEQLFVSAIITQI